jgi:hypothetical protein
MIILLTSQFRIDPKKEAWYNLLAFLGRVREITVIIGVVAVISFFDFRL